MEDRTLISAATVEDIPELYAMTAEFCRYIHAIDPKESPLPKFAAETLHRHLFGPQPLVHGLLARRADRAIGYLIYYFGYFAEEATPALHIADLFVREDARGSKVGLGLMQAAVEALEARGGTRLYWQVWRKNRAAIAFYRQLGARFDPEPLMCWPSGQWLSHETKPVTPR